jgi:MoaA/NifB/PqqE/SkfB family radical SAM enzyme
MNNRLNFWKHNRHFDYLKTNAKKLAKDFYDGSRDKLVFKHGKGAFYDGLMALRNHTVGSFLRIDICTICQLKCRKCSTSNGLNRKGVIGWGAMKAADFARIIDQQPRLRLVEVSNWGEIFLNPDLSEIMRIARRNGVKLKAGNGVNLNRAPAEALESLVRERFDYLSVSLDGASQETYSIYRCGGEFDRVIENIRTINRLKKKHGVDRPKMMWQFIIFGHNEHELPQARRMAAELGMNFRAKLNHTPSYSPIRDPEFVRRESGLGVASREEFKALHKRAYKRPCLQLWENPQINWDGKLLGCCINKFGDFGNVLEDGLQATLNGEKYRYAKKMVMGKLPPRNDIPCVKCNVYQEMVRERRQPAQQADCG